MIRRPPNSTLFPYPPLSRSRLLQLAQRLLQIDDVDAGTFGEDEPPHLRIPPARLMAEVDPCFQQFLQLRLRHALPFRVRSEEHTSELQSHLNLVCRLLLEKK